MYIRRCEIVSKLYDGDNMLFDMENLEKILSEKKSAIKDFAYIVHDKDMYTPEDEEENPAHKYSERKPAHIHLLLRFHQSQNSKYVAKWFGIEENFVSKIHGKWEDACLYLIHWNNIDQYIYGVDEVVCNFDFKELLKDDDEKKEDPLTTVLNRILNGEIKEYNKTREIDKLFLVKHSRMINEAFKVRAQDLQTTQRERSMECIYICGSSDSGKTELAKQIAKSRGLEYSVSSGSNDILDQYHQEPALIVDEIRPYMMELSDLLKMLDNHTASSVKSRFQNKYLNCDLVILTTIFDIDTFFEDMPKKDGEPAIQLKRRCGTYIQMDKDNIHVSTWDSLKMEYTNTVTCKNTVLDQYIPKTPLTIADTKNRIAELMPFLEPIEDAGQEADFITATEDIPFEEIDDPKIF